MYNKYGPRQEVAMQEGDVSNPLWSTTVLSCRENSQPSGKEVRDFPVRTIGLNSSYCRERRVRRVTVLHAGYSPVGAKTREGTKRCSIL